MGALVVLLLGSAALPSTQQSGVPLAFADRPGGDSIAGAVADGDGGIWIAGNTTGDRLTASADAVQPQPGGFIDGFVAHLGADGTLLHATFLGGSAHDRANAIARDAAGNLYVAGGTFSSDFPTTANALQTAAPGDWNAFVVKLDPTGRHMLYATYLGGSGFDEAFDVIADGAGVAHVVGETRTGFPITSGRCLSGWRNAFYSRLATDGASLNFGTCLDDSVARGVALDSIGDAYVVGIAFPHFSPQMSPLKTFPSTASSQGFLAKFSGSSIPISTLIGGSRSDEANAVAVTAKGIYIAGEGVSSDYPGAPSRNPSSSFDSTAWITKIWLDGHAVIGTTLIDGSGNADQATALQVDAGEVVHMTGWTNSSDFPATSDAAQPTFAGGFDAFYATAWMPQNTVGDPSYLTFLGARASDLGNAVVLDGTGGAWIAGAGSAIDFPSVNAKTNAPTSAFVARYGQPRQTPSDGSADIVLYARDASAIAGNWHMTADSTAAGGTRAWNPDGGVPKITTPAANPATYVEYSFVASAGVPYHLWLRLKAENDYWGNDSVWVQFSDSIDDNGNAVWRTGTTSGTWVGLEDCSGCGVQGWGWNDNGYGTVGVPVVFASTGSHTIRIQQREDGVSIDQIVLSSAQWAARAPGSNKNDETIVAPTAPPPPPPPPSTNPREIVLYAGREATINGDWLVIGDQTAAAGLYLLNQDRGAPKLGSPTAAGPDYFELSFTAEAGIPYHLWIRSLATNDHWANDSVFVQFSGSVDASGTPTFRIGSDGATVVSLEDCSGCGEQGWGWNDNAYGAFAAPIYFATSGPQTIRVLRREDGISIDQIVISAGRFLNAAPGQAKNDTTIVPK